MINNNTILKPNEELNVVIDPSAYTHKITYKDLIKAYNNHKTNNLHPFSDEFLQLYFEDPKNKCILIRGCKDEYSHNGGEIKLTTEDKFALDRRLHGEYNYDEIYNIIKKQADVLGINLQNIKKINIFDISHTDKNTKRFSTGRINEKVNALKALNELCPNCEHTKIASTACWGGRKSPVGKDIIEEVKKSIEDNKDWHKNNIVEIDITPEDDNDTQIRLGQDNKPHVSYCLDDKMYTNFQQPLPQTFTRHIHLLAKGKNEIDVPQEHKFQNDQYRVAEGEGGFQELSINQIRQIMFHENNQQILSQQQLQQIQIANYQPIQQTIPQNYILQNYKPQNSQPNNIIQTSYCINKYNQPVYTYNNNVRYIVNQRPVVKNVMMPLQPNITTPLIRQPIQHITTQIKHPIPVTNNVSPRNNNYQYHLPSKTINNNYYNNNATRSFDCEAKYRAWLKTQDYINWITYDIKNQYPEYRNATFSFRPLI